MADTSSALDGYLLGSIDLEDNAPSYLLGSTNLEDNAQGCLHGSAIIDTSLSGYISGTDTDLSSVSLYLCGEDEDTSSLSALTHGSSVGSADTEVYLLGALHGVENTSAYLYGVIRGTAESYLSGNESAESSQLVYVNGLIGDKIDSIRAYCTGVLRSTIESYMEGIYMSVDYIWLKTSDTPTTKAKKFRVLAQDYDDGTLDKAEEVSRTLGGGIDHSVGAVYKTWSPIIRVRHTENEANYGDMDDLEYFFSLNNPNGTPNNDIIFIDHRQVEYTVHTVGKLTKNLLSACIEGPDAWYLYKLQFMRVQ